jgi:hypothetical protein
MMWRQHQIVYLQDMWHMKMHHLFFGMFLHGMMYMILVLVLYFHKFLAGKLSLMQHLTGNNVTLDIEYKLLVLFLVDNILPHI